MTQAFAANRAKKTFLLNLIDVIAKKYYRRVIQFWIKIICRTPIYCSLGSNIMEPRPQYIGAPQNFVFQNSLGGMEDSCCCRGLGNSNSFLSLAVVCLKFEYLCMKWNILDKQVYFGRYDGLHYIGARAPLYWSLGSNISEPLLIKNMFFFNIYFFK